MIDLDFETIVCFMLGLGCVYVIFRAVNWGV